MSGRWLAIGALCLLPAAIGAQQIRGVVHDSASAMALPGAVVLVIDSTGTTAARTIATGDGRFSVARPARAASLHVIRIGYQPRDLPIATAGDVELSFSMFKLPAMLNAVRVSDHELCPGSTERGSAFQLWEQARAGLLAAVVTTEANPAVVTTVIYDRFLSLKDGLVNHQRSTTRNGATTRPFVAAATAPTFAARGYMVEESDGRVFAAPDANILLDESFAATHCFHLQNADAAHRDQIGLAFTPAPGRDTLVEVTGVIWLDRATPAVRSFDFLYTGLEPAAIRAGVGGRLEFENLANGVSFISWWTLRLPIMQEVAQSRNPYAFRTPPRGGVTRRQDRTDISLVEIQESGGQVEEAKWGDGTVWREEATTIAGTATERKTRQPIPFALVTLAETVDTVRADAQGQFTIAHVIPGRFKIEAIDTTLGAYTPPRTDSRIIEVARGKTAAYDPQFPAVRSVLADVCKGHDVGGHTATLVGRVVLPNGDEPRTATITAKWQANYNQGSGINTGAGSTLTVDGAQQQIDVDDSGRFLVCGVAVERPIHLHFALGVHFADTTVVTYDSLLKRVDWRPSAMSIVADAPASLIGLVTRDPGQLAMPGVIVSIPSLRRTVITDVDGTFQLTAIPPGSYELQLHHAGDPPIVEQVQLGPGARLLRTYTFARARPH